MSWIEDQLDGIRRLDLDAVGRVTAVHGQGWTESYAYDAAGNVTHADWPGALQSQGPREYAGTLIRRAGNASYQHDS